MAQHDYSIANQTFPNTRSDLNNSLSAIVSNNSGATEPSTTYAYQWWYDETTDTLKMRNSDNDAWITMFTFDQTADTYSLATDVELTITENLDLTGNATISGDLTVTQNSSISVPTLTIEDSDTGIISNQNLGRIDFKQSDTNDPGVSARIQFDSDFNNGIAGLQLWTGSPTSLTKAFEVDNNGDISFYEDTGTTPKLFWDASAERLEIATNFTVGASNSLSSSDTTTRFIAAEANANIRLWAASDVSQPVFFMHRPSSTGEMFRFVQGDPASTVGTISVTTSATSYNTSSDYRLKENVIEITGAIERLKQLSPKRFNFIADADTTVDGFLAHEVSDIVPEAITGTKDETETKEKVVVNSSGQVIAENIEEVDWENGKIADEDGSTKYPIDSTWEATKIVPVYQGIDQSKLVPLLTASLQEAIAKIEELETRLTALEA